MYIKGQRQRGEKHLQLNRYELLHQTGSGPVGESLGDLSATTEAEEGEGEEGDQEEGDVK